MRISALLIGAALIVGCDRTYTDTMPPPDPADPGMEQPEPEARTYTLKDYEAVSSGMSRAEVETVLGAGESVSTSEIAGVETEVVIWKNPDFSNLVVTFQNGTVTSVAQTNLK